jgi:glutamate-1-semialdehyde 2,1-aminomutase
VASALRSAAAAADVPLTINRVASMLTAFFTADAVRDYSAAKHADVGLFASWFRRLLTKGVLLPPSQFEAAFVSTAHDEEALAFLESCLSDSLIGLRSAALLG